MLSSAIALAYTDAWRVMVIAEDDALCSIKKRIDSLERNGESWNVALVASFMPKKVVNALYSMNEW